MNAIRHRIGAAFASAVLGGLFMLVAAVPTEALELSSAYQGWSLHFDAPELATQDYKVAPESFRYYGKTAEGLFVSLHVEKVLPLGGTNADCERYYWRRAANKIPQVDNASLRRSSYAGFEQLNYIYRLEYKGHQWDMPNAHLFFAIGDQCANLHIGASPLIKDFDEQLAKVTASLRIQTSALAVQASSDDLKATRKLMDTHSQGLR